MLEGAFIRPICFFFKMDVSGFLAKLIFSKLSKKDALWERFSEKLV